VSGTLAAVFSPGDCSAAETAGAARNPAAAITAAVAETRRVKRNLVLRMGGIASPLGIDEMAQLRRKQRAFAPCPIITRFTCG
jgi:hypothetical protein